MQVLITEYGEPIGADAFKMVSKVVRWRGKPGHLYQRGGGSSNSHSKRKHWTKLQAEQAMSFGWLNGIRIRKAR